MTTKYDVGDFVLVPAIVDRISISSSGEVFYELKSVCNINGNNICNVREENMGGLLNDLKTEEEKEKRLAEALGYFG